MQVRVTDTGEFNLYQNLVWGGPWNRDLFKINA